MPSKKRSTPSSSKNISIGRDVVDSVVINGDNNVVNYFKGEYILLKEHYIAPDSVFQRVRTEDFVGRDWLTVQVDAFLNDPQRKSGAFLLIGDAGVGKTSFMAHLVKERGYLHLFAEQVPGQAMLQRAIQSLGSQLVTRYQIDPYKDRDTLIQGTVFPDFLERLLRMAASKLTGGEKIVIVCDALDEAGTFPDGNVFGLPNVLPDGVYLILSQRPVNVKLPNLEPLTVRLEAQGADNLGDMEKYLRAVAQRASVADQIRAKNYSDAFFIQTLKEKSLGVWMYLHYVIKEIEQGSRAPLELEALPTGLVGYYADFWGDWRMGRKGRGEGEKAWNALYAPLLTTLAAAQEAITIGKLIQWAEVDADEDEVTRLVAEDWRAFIEEKEIGAETRYKPYHLSFADFIAGRADGEKLPPAQKNLMRDLAKRTVKAHGRIVQVFEAECNGQWDRLVEREYPRLHLSAHLNGAGEYETLRILLTEGDEKIKWAEAREKKEETYAGYLNDLSYVWAYAEREQNYVLAIRCMLIENSIHSLAANIPINVMNKLAKAGIWSYVRCLSVIRETANPIIKAEHISQIVPNLPPELHHEAFVIASEIKNKSGCALALASLIPYLNDELKKQALHIIFSSIDKIKGDTNFLIRVLSLLAPYLDNIYKPQVLIMANQEKDEYRHLKFIINLLPYTDKTQRKQVFQEALNSAYKIKEIHFRCDALINLLPHAPIKQRNLAKEILFLAHEITDKYPRCNTLVDILPYLSNNNRDRVVQEALLIAHKIENTQLRVKVYLKLLPYLPHEVKSKVTDKALLAAYKVTEEASRINTLISVVPYLSIGIKSQVLQESIAMASKIKDEKLRAETLLTLLPHLSNNAQRSQILQESLAELRKIKDGYILVEALTSLTPYLSNEIKAQVLSESLAMTLNIKFEYGRAAALAILVPQLNGDLKILALEEALITSKKITDKSSRANVLISLLPNIANELRSQVFMEALILINDIESEYSQGDTLIALSAHLTENCKIPMLSTARAIKSEEKRIQVFASIIPYLDVKTKTQVLKESFKIAHRIKSTAVLAPLIPYLSNDIKEHTRNEAFNETKKIENDYFRAKTWVTLIPHLSGSRKKEAIQDASLAIQDINSEYIRAIELTFLAAYLNDEILISNFQEALHILDTLLLNKVFKKWQDINFKGLKENIIPFVNLASQIDRSEGMFYIAKLIPSIIYFRGHKIAGELYRTIMDVTRWWT